MSIKVFILNEMGKINKKKALINFAALLLVVVFVYFLSDFVRESDEVKNLIMSYGYFGLFVVAIASGFNLVVPIPAIAFLPIVLSVGLSATVSVIVIAIGMTAGDGIGFLLGKTGRMAVEKKTFPKFVQKLEAYLQKHPRLVSPVVFLYAAFVPAPNEIIVIPLSFLDRHWTQIILPVLAGNFIFNALVALGIMSFSGIL